MIRRALLVFGVAAALCFGITGCDGTPGHGFGEGIAESIGLADPKPMPPILVDALCDSSDGASCTAATLRELIDNILPVIAERPGSILRIWSLGDDLPSTTIIATSVNTRRTALSGRVERSAQTRFVAEETAFLMKAVMSIFSATRPRQSPIAEGIGRIALAHAAPGVLHLYVVLSDGLQFSHALGDDFECGTLPAASAWSSRLAAEQVFAAGALRNSAIAFTHVTPVPIARKGCPKASLARFGQVRNLWTTALTAAGARKVVFETGALDINDYVERNHAIGGGAL